MREFRGYPNALTRLAPGAKLLYLSFILFTLVGLLGTVLLYADGWGWGIDSAADYVLGNEGDPNAAEMLFPKPTRELLETSHFHLFTIPVTLLVLAHLFLLARGGAWKNWVVGAAIALTAVHMAGPWLIHLMGRGLGWIMPLTAWPFMAVLVFMALWPLPDLRPWIKQAPPPPPP